MCVCVCVSVCVCVHVFWESGVRPSTHAHTHTRILTHITHTLTAGSTLSLAWKLSQGNEDQWAPEKLKPHRSHRTRANAAPTPANLASKKGKWQGGREGSKHKAIPMVGGWG